MIKPYTNPNPRIGVLLDQHGASVRLYNVLNPPFGKRGLLWLEKHWPEARLRKECPGYGAKISQEWRALLARRAGRLQRLSMAATNLRIIHA